MGTHVKGIPGGFSGKVGPVIGSTWKDKGVLRSRPKKPVRVKPIPRKGCTKSPVWYGRQVSEFNERFVNYQVI